jgi:SSS family solute:Na+ symporter
MLIMMVISYIETRGADHPKAIIITKNLFKTGPAFNIGAFVIMLIVAMLYAIFW